MTVTWGLKMRRLGEQQNRYLIILFVGIGGGIALTPLHMFQSSITSPSRCEVQSNIPWITFCGLAFTKLFHSPADARDIPALPVAQQVQKPMRYTDDMNIHPYPSRPR